MSSAAVIRPVSGSMRMWAVNPSCWRDWGLVRVRGVRVHGGDYPVRCDVPGDTPPPVGPVRILGRFHVLPGDQCQQRIRIGHLAVQGLGIDDGQQRQRIGDQRRNKPVPGILVIPRDVRFAVRV